MPIAEHAYRAFVFGDDPKGQGLRRRVADYVEESNFTIEYVVDAKKVKSDGGGSPEAFGLFLRPNQTARRMYGLDREVLLWCSTFSDFQARDIEAMRSEVDKHGARLSRQFAILLTKSEPSQRSQLEFEATLDQSLVHTSFVELEERGLQGVLAKSLFSRDLFNVTGATTRPVDFFGRRELLDRMVSEVQTGTTQLGLFGLRKVGKTSLLNRIADRLQHSGTVFVARLDLQWTVAINPRPEYSLWALGEAIYASHRAVRNIHQFKMFGNAATFSDLTSQDEVWEYFAHDLTLILQLTRRRVCVLIDEIERMYESPSERGFVRFWRLLRGLDQQNPGRLRFIVGGTSPQCAEKGEVAGEDNPLFRYLSLEFLGPLDADEARGLLTGLGAPMGLSFDSEALAWAGAASGGHPALLRSLGSTVHRTHLDRQSVVVIGEAEMRRGESAASRESVSVLDQMLAVLQDQYADEFLMLEMLAHGQLSQYRQFAAAFPSEEQHLRRYGLVVGEDVPALSMGLLHQHLLARERSLGVHGQAPSPLAKGASIGPWEVRECVSSGAYGVVYRVQSEGRRAAAKVLGGGQLSMLQREVEILRDLEHPSIVRVLDALQTDGGQPCLIMEFLDGPTLAGFCTPMLRPPAKTIATWACSILDALKLMHPDQTEVRRLEKEEALTSADLSTWDRARHGYVHRDIKPENILLVPERGPVLVDFNISIRSGSPVLTTSATPGYCPPAGVTWEPAVDLYALGITLLELAAGQRLASSTLADLHELAAVSGSAPLLAAVDGLLQAPETGLTARDALRPFDRVRRDS